VATPVELSVKLVKHGEGVAEFTSKLYTEAVVAMLYLAGCTRPDIARAVSALSRYVSPPPQSTTGVQRSGFCSISGARTRREFRMAEMQQIPTQKESSIRITCAMHTSACSQAMYSAGSLSCSQLWQHPQPTLQSIWHQAKAARKLPSTLATQAVGRPVDHGWARG
jgi:hypothetical protein